MLEKHMPDMGSGSMNTAEQRSGSKEMCPTLSSAVGKTKKREQVSSMQLRKIMVWLASFLLHCNAQRPGAITNAILTEYKAGTVSTRRTHTLGQDMEQPPANTKTSRNM